MKRMINVAVLMGGRSAEHEISLVSALNIIGILTSTSKGEDLPNEKVSKNKEYISKYSYNVYPIGITRQGTWTLLDKKELEGMKRNNDNKIPLEITGGGEELCLHLGKKFPIRKIKNTSDSESMLPIDLVIPALHGPYGEDGSIQGLLRYIDLPFVGCNILASALGMDKDMMKVFLKKEVHMARSVTVHAYQFFKDKSTNIEILKGEEDSKDSSADISIEFETLEQTLGLPLFIKPCRQGSSVGVHKVSTKEMFYSSMKDALSFDSKVLIEECILGRELEVAVLGNTRPRASVVGEIEVCDKNEFYSFEAKYINDRAVLLHAPAEIEIGIQKELQITALRVYKLLGLEGLARVDFFLTKENKIYLNEINTFPGFTHISMYPKLWEKSGMEQKELLEILIDLALEREKGFLGLKLKP